MFILLLLCDFIAVLTVNEVTPNFSRGFEIPKPKPDPPKPKHDPQNQS